MEPNSIPDTKDRTQVNPAIAAAFFQYDEAGLRMPPIPHELAADVDSLGEWIFSTTEDGLASREDFLALADRADAAPQVAFGHAGHGINSWWLHYRLIRGPLAVFLRIRYGGVYVDNEAQAAKANGAIEAIEELVVRADVALAKGRLSAGQRLVVVIDDQAASGWRVSGGDGGWVESADPLEDAVAFLTATGPS